MSVRRVLVGTSPVTSPVTSPAASPVTSPATSPATSPVKFPVTTLVTSPVTSLVTSLVMSLGLSLAALAGCDSATPFRADLGLAGDPPAIDAALGGAPGAQTITFTAPAGGALPDDWNRAQTIRVVLSGAGLPLSKTPAGLVAGVPPTVSFTKPLDDKAIQMTFVVDGDHVSVARVTFK